MSYMNAKKDEIDLIRSVFSSDELNFTDPSLIEQLDLLASQKIPLEDKDVRLTLKISFSQLSVSVNLSVNLPVGYPQKPPSILLRVWQSEPVINEKALNAAFHEWLDAVSGAGDPVICAAVDWLRSALDEDHRNFYLGRDRCKTSKSNALLQHHVDTVEQLDKPSSSEYLCDGVSNDSEVCYWIFSHHIRNPKKRKVIVDWARELYLTGCCLPGKPGIVVVEGPDDKVEEYWRRIKVLTWKRIQVKDRETITKRRFMDGFFEVGGTLGEKIAYMRDHGVGQERIAAHFGFKFDETSDDNKKKT